MRISIVRSFHGTRNGPTCSFMLHTSIVHDLPGTPEHFIHFKLDGLAGGERAAVAGQGP